MSDWRHGEPRNVAFVDIVGFAAELKALESRPEDLPRIVDALLGGLESPANEDDQGVAQEFYDIDRQQVFFSDCAIVSARCVPGAVDDILHVILSYARRLLERGFFLRGGIARGLAVHHEHRLVVGPAVLKAYLMERDAAHYPRIVIEDDIARELLAVAVSPNPIATVRISEDRIYYVDVLATLGLRSDGIQALCKAYEVILRRLRDSGNFAHRAKWRWMAAQYNWAVDYVASSGIFAEGLPPMIREDRD